MSGAEAALRAARLGDEVVHGFGLMGMVAGALIGAAIAAAIVVAGVATGGLAVAAIIAGCIAGGGLAGGALARGIMKAADLPGPTTGMLAAAGPSRVTVNSRMALRAGMDFAPGCSGAPINHFAMPGPVLIAEGSQTVTINGRPMARQSMKLVCGAKIKGGSGNVTVGGPNARVVEVHDNEASFETGLKMVGMIALAAAGAGAVAAGLGATLMFGGIVAASHYGMEALHNWGESLGPGYGDIMVGVAGFALLGAGPRLARTPAGRGAIDVLNRTRVKVEPGTLGSNLGNVRIGLKPKSLREQYMGSTPDKFSRTGREVMERIRAEGKIQGEGPLVRGNPNNLKVQDRDGNWHRIDEKIDMAHTTDAVSWWNAFGKHKGAKAPEVRDFMLNSKNYELQPGSINRSEGAQLGQTYESPVAPVFGKGKK